MPRGAGQLPVDHVAHMFVSSATGSYFGDAAANVTELGSRALVAF